MYCAIASLAFLNRLPTSVSSSSAPAVKGDLLPGLTNIPLTIRWLVSRQVGYRVDEEEDEDEDPAKAQREAMVGIHKDKFSVPGLSLEDEEFVGFNGRCNKNVDTCYTFWVVASLDVSPTSH
jgi:geranylgeranyl transferase type-1 subunit beta